MKRMCRKWKRDEKEIFGEEERVQRIIEEETKRKKGRRGEGIEKVEEGADVWKYINRKIRR